jgi:hypothetical protein
MNYKVQGPDGKIYTGTAPDNATKEQILAHVKMNYKNAKPMGLVEKMGNLVQPYLKSQAFSPQNMLGQQVPQGLNYLANKEGQFVTEQLSKPQNRVDPYTAAAIGTATQMAPDIIMASNTPVGEPEEANKSSIKWASRSLGASKRFRMNPFQRGKVAQAGKVALEEGLIPGAGNPQTTFDRATALRAEMGHELGQTRESVGPQPVYHVFNELNMLRNKATEGGARGGVWDAIHTKIDEAKNTIKGLYGSRADSPLVIENEMPPAQQQPPSTGSYRVKQELPYYTKGELGRETKDLPFKSQISKPPESRLPATEADLKKPEYEIPHYEPKGPPPNFKEKPPTIIDAEIVTNEAADPVKRIIHRLNLNAVEHGKTELTGKAFTKNERNLEQSISTAIERGVEKILRRNGVDMDAYKAAKFKYGGASSALRYLNNEIAGQEGNMAASPLSVGAGAVNMAQGNPLGALRDAGLIEFAKRRGAGVLGTSLYKAGETVPKIMTTIGLLRKLRKDRNENPGNQ